MPAIRTILLPNVELNMESVTVTDVFVRRGDKVAVGQALGAVETQKANIEINSEEAGYVHEVFIRVGDEVGEKAPVCSVGDEPPAEGEPEVPADQSATAPAVEPVPQKPPAPGAEPPAGDGIVIPPGKVRASPVARKLAKSLGIELVEVKGTGPAGRVMRRDVEEFQAGRIATPAAPQATPPSGEGWQVFPPQRAALISQMQAAAATVPVFSLTRRIDLSPLFRKQPGITVTHRLVFCLGRALGRHTTLMTTIERGKFRIEEVSVAVAMDTLSGLVAPAVRNPQALTVQEISATIQLLKARADAGQLKRADFERAPFALSNLGMYGVDQFQPSVFQGQCAVLGVGRATDAEAGRKAAWFTLICDHRAVDGAEAARFLQTLQETIDSP